MKQVFQGQIRSTYSRAGTYSNKEGDIVGNVNATLTQTFIEDTGFGGGPDGGLVCGYSSPLSSAPSKTPNTIPAGQPGGLELSSCIQWFAGLGKAALPNWQYIEIVLSRDSYRSDDDAQHIPFIITIDKPNKYICGMSQGIAPPTQAQQTYWMDYQWGSDTGNISVVVYRGLGSSTPDTGVAPATKRPSPIGWTRGWAADDICTLIINVDTGVITQLPVPGGLTLVPQSSETFAGNRTLTAKITYDDGISVNATPTPTPSVEGTKISQLPSATSMESPDFLVLSRDNPVDGTYDVTNNITFSDFTSSISAEQGAIGYTEEWFQTLDETVQNGATLTITHNLDATNVIVQVYVNSSASDTNAQIVSSNYAGGGGVDYGAITTNLTSNAITLQLGKDGWLEWDSSGAATTENFSPKFLKVVVLKVS